MTDLIKGLSQIYDESTGKTTVTWSYRDTPELEHFILEYYDDIKKKWIPYDEHMGIIRKGETTPRITTEDTPTEGDSIIGNGSPGKDGKSIEYIWRQTSLGIRLAGDKEYDYVNLKGSKGERGEKGERGPASTLDDLTKGAVLTALGYTPANKQFLEEQLAEKESKQETDRKVNQAFLSAKEYIDSYGIPTDAKFTDTITSINNKTGIITKEDIMAIGIPGKDTVYKLPVAGAALGGIKSGGDVNVSSDGLIEVKDNSHKHTISDITNLEEFINGPQKYSAKIGGASTITVTHNLNSRDLNVTLRETNSPYSQVYTTVEFTELNKLTVKFKEVPSAEEYTITIIG